MEVALSMRPVQPYVGLVFLVTS